MVRAGGDVTILCYSRMRYVVMQAVAQLEKEGYDPEVPRTARAVLWLGQAAERLMQHLDCMALPVLMPAEQALMGNRHLQW